MPTGEMNGFLYSILGDSPEPEFEAIANAAARLFDCPHALVSFVEAPRYWTKANVGTTGDHIASEQSFSTHVRRQNNLLLIEDASSDPRFQRHLLSNDCTPIRFYAGVPICISCQSDAPALPVGTLAVMSPERCKASLADMAPLTGLARAVAALVEGRLKASRERARAHSATIELTRHKHLYSQFRRAESMAAMGSWRLSLDTDTVEWSDGVWDIHELPRSSDVSLSDALDFYTPISREKIAEALRRAHVNGEPYDLELDLVTAKGKMRRVRAVCEIEYDDGHPIALTGIFQDITGRYRLQKKLERKVNTDALTGLSSREHFDSMSRKRIARAKAEGGNVALALIDIDRFKDVNDTRGHVAGDDVLRAVASVLEAEWLRGSPAARFGGDEFVLMLSDAALIDALPQTISRLLRELIHVSPNGDRVTTTIGACITDARKVNSRGLLLTADEALYRAKRECRGTGAIAGHVALIQPSGECNVDAAGTIRSEQRIAG